VQLGFCQIFRLFLMPFCVSSFAALVNGKNFVSLFAESARDFVGSDFLRRTLRSGICFKDWERADPLTTPLIGFESSRSSYVILGLISPESILLRLS